MSPLRRRSRILFALLALLVLACGLAAMAWYDEVPAAVLEARYADAASEFIEVHGSRVHFKDEGEAEAPPLLLIHGTAASLHTWDGWVAALGERFRLLRLDLPGYGLTGPNRAGEGGGDYSIDYRIRVIEALMRQRDVGRLAVAGNSLGGMIAWRYALAHPERVAALVLVDAAGAPQVGGEGEEQAVFRIIDLAAMPVARDLMVRLTPRLLVRRALLQVYGDPDKVDEALVERHHQLLLREGNRQAMVEAASNLIDRDLDPPLHRVTQPTLVMWGREDRLISVADAETFHHRLPDSELVIYDGAGHVPMEEIPERTANDAAEFLQRRLVTDPPGDPASGDAGELTDAALRRPAA